MSQRRTGASLVAMIGVAALLLIGLVVLSPLALSWIAGARRDWVTPANIGQAYGGVAAVLSGLALCGVVVSIFLQRQQLAVQVNLAVRERQFDLTRILLEYPEATAKLLGSSISTESALLNLHIAQWWLVFDTQAADPASLKAELALVFRTEEARSWWAHGGGPVWRTFRGNRSLAFARLVDEAVEVARAHYAVEVEDAAEAATEEGEPSGRRAPSAAAQITAVGGLLAGAGILWWASGRRRPPDGGQRQRRGHSPERRRRPRTSSAA